ncbi:MAG: hypothetical protein WD399_07385 [Thermoleophilaceae bacterium]
MSEAAAEPWRDEIVAAYHAGSKSSADAFDTITVTFDGEYLRYFDRALDGMCLADERLPRPSAAVRALMRSAAVSVVAGAFVMRRTVEVIGDDGGAADAMTGNLENILLGGLVQRVSPTRRERLAAVELRLATSCVRDIDAEVRSLAVAHMARVDVESYLGEEFDDLRSAFVEASMLTWLIWRGLVAEEAVPSTDTYAQLAREHGNRRRPTLPASVKRVLGRL